MYGSFSGGLAAVAFLFFFQACGLCLGFLAFPRETPAARILLGSVLGSVGLQWLPVLAAFGLGFTVQGHMVAAGFAAAAVGLGVFLAKKRGRTLAACPQEAVFMAFSHSKSLWLVLALWVFYCWLVFHSFHWEDGKIFSSQATYGDMSMHLSFITSLARQGTFPPDYSLLPGVRLSYPFLSDSISSSLYLLGAPLWLSYCLPMQLAGAQVFFGGWLLLRALSGGRRKGIFAWSLFFFNGGLGLMYFLGSGLEGFTRIFTAFYETPTNYSAGNIRWVNVVADMLLPQRATLFGWAVLFPCLYLLYRAAFRGKRQYFPLVGGLAGALPMIHTHSFLALALVCGAWLTVGLCRAQRLGRLAASFGKAMILLGLIAMALLYDGLPAGLRQENSPPIWGVFLLGMAIWAAALGTMIFRQVCRGRGGRLLRTWGLLLLITCLLALPQLFTWTFRQVSNGSMVRGHLGWAIGEVEYLWFYLKNMGLVAILAAVGLLLATPRTFAKYCPAMVIWFVAEFVEFQPNDYDNNKLLYVGFLFLCCAAADCLERLLGKLQRQGAKNCAAAALAALLAVPAVLTLGREAVASYEVYGNGAMDLAMFIDDQLPPSAVILTDQRHNNEAAALAGRNVVCGSPIYLFYHGLNYYGSEQAAKAMFEDPQGSRELFQRFRVDYVLVSDFERSSFQVDTAALDSMFPKEYDDGVRVLYRVEEDWQR